MVRFNYRNDKNKDRKKKTEQEKSDKNKKDAESKDTLIYFIAHIESVTEVVDLQITSYAEHSKRLKDQPLESHVLGMYVMEDLNRALFRLDHEKLFHAYLDHYGRDKERIKRFQNIFQELAYISKLCEHADKAQERHQEELIRNLTQYKDLSEEQIMTFATLVTNKIRYSKLDYANDNFYCLLNDSITKYHKDGPKIPSIHYMQEKFIEPLRNALMNFRHIDAGVDILDNCRRATWLYNGTVRSSEMESDNFTAYHNGLQKANAKLKDLVKDIEI